MTERVNEMNARTHNLMQSQNMIRLLPQQKKLARASAANVCAEQFAI